jgi:ketosteroid isomerase-like protein
MRRPLPLTAALLALSCAHAPAAPAPLDEATRQAMATDAAWSAALGAGERAAFLAGVADEAVFAGGRRLLRGKEAIGAGWATFFRPDAPRFSWRPDGGGAAASGDLAWTTGSFRIEARGAGGAPQVNEGRYLSVWSRGADGRWRAELDCGYQPAAALEPLERAPVRTVTSSDGALEATLGTWTAAEPGPRAGAWLRVRARDGAGWRVVLDSAVPFAEE